MPSSQNTGKTEVWHKRLRLIMLRMLPHHGLSRLIYISSRLNGFLGRWLVRAQLVAMLNPPFSGSGLAEQYRQPRADHALIAQR